MSIRKILLLLALFISSSVYGCDVGTGYLACIDGENCIADTPECCSNIHLECTEEESIICQEIKDTRNNTCKPERHNNCNKCPNGAICVNDSNGLGIMIVCSLGDYSEFPCNNVSCNEDFSACGKCLNGTHCVDDEETQIGSLISCELGKIIEQTECGTKESKSSCLKGENACGDCINNDSQCKISDKHSGYNSVRKCVDGKYEETECPDKISCNKDQKDCGECQNGLLCRVSKNTYNKCKEGEWKLCSNEDHCVPTLTTRSCMN